MARREEFKLVRRHVQLYEGDWERLQAIYGSTLGVSKAIRTIIRTICDRVETEAANRVSIDLEITHD